eukprot:m.175003 g.175003  ORF g.175003 m.175003 type:complete len:185 (-) comp16544_c0_seq6:1735-2289(-)
MVRSAAVIAALAVLVCLGSLISPSVGMKEKHGMSDYVQVIVIERPPDSCEPVQHGDHLKIKFVGVIEEEDRIFTEQPEVLDYVMGEPTFVKGWEYGLEGVCEGEKRTVIIPPHLAFGSQGRPPHIPPNVHLKFHIEVVEVVAHGAGELPHKQTDMIILGVCIIALVALLLCWRKAAPTPKPKDA